jgi:hypothetical protein
MIKVNGFEFTDNEIRDVVLDKIATQVLYAIGYETRNALEEKIARQVEQLDTAEISKQATAFLIAKVMGEIK